MILLLLYRTKTNTKTTVLCLITSDLEVPQCIGCAPDQEDESGQHVEPVDVTDNGHA